jgi:hypothetical protein
VAPEPPSIHGVKTKNEARLEAKQDQKPPVTQSEEDKLSRKQRKQGAGTDLKPSAAITSSKESGVVSVEEQKQVVAQVSASREQLLR